MAITNCEKVALILNGKPVGEKPIDPYQMAYFDVPYEAGKLEAVATTGGKELAGFSVQTTGPAAKVELIADRAKLAGDGWDTQPITVQITDSDGHVIPTAKELVKFSVTGPGAIIGLNNGDPNCHESEKGTEHTVFNGLAQIILRSSPSSQGLITLHATSENLTAAELTIDVVPSPARISVPVVARETINQQRAASGNRRRRASAPTTHPATL
jgi:beta-galactosidase